MNDLEPRLGDVRVVSALTVKESLTLLVEDEATTQRKDEKKTQKSEKKPRRRCSEWCSKYFCAGQIMDDDQQQENLPVPEGSGFFYANFIWKRPKIVTVFLPFIFVITGWLTFMVHTDSWYLYYTGIGESKTPGWNLFVMMIFGSLVAGATSEGGGSVAFPVMTLVLGISATIARDFSLMIQSIGMTAAAFGILYSRIAINWPTLKWASLGGSVGIILGLQFIAPAIPGDYTKMIFVSVFFAFAIHLYLLNRQKKRTTHIKIPEDPNVVWVRAVLVFQGLIGGVLSALAGSGIDICTFTLLVLGFRLSEKIATPTSVCLMAGNTVLGFFWRGAVMQEIAPETYAFWICAVPAVVIGAPVGAFVSSFLHRQVLACAVYITDTGQFIAALVIVPQTVPLIATTLASFSSAFVGFWAMSRFGRRYDEQPALTTTAHAVEKRTESNCGKIQGLHAIILDNNAGRKANILQEGDSPAQPSSS